eukprot:CAMPEP_0201285726 /NCGR_PEP_ID=MMETSP1317-20130820/113742_1 /ASSEMBLY_ACC=CAM_ASM_000770 /TAXON_ID=187299 /ORGANISM="Undescribed Undescribed, Strain Undescribed" /LENGTH=83 /DNA_ID=CAMNT_0047611571 /DNA_START=1 /DNA_END=252 /DNA_ORIENTATION=-
MDRSTEELTADHLLRCLKFGQTIHVARHYVRHRNHIGIPYYNDGRINPNPEFGPKDFVIICVGGNDFALRGVMDPAEILRLIH